MKQKTEAMELARSENERRQKSGWAAMKAFVAEQSDGDKDADMYGMADLEDFLADLLANLRHMARERGVDFEEADRRANCQYGEEVLEEGGTP